jgi:hypothetical protein
MHLLKLAIIKAMPSATIRPIVAPLVLFTFAYFIIPFTALFVVLMLLPEQVASFKHSAVIAFTHTSYLL